MRRAVGDGGGLQQAVLSRRALGYKKPFPREKTRQRQFQYRLLWSAKCDGTRPALAGPHSALGGVAIRLLLPTKTWMSSLRIGQQTLSLGQGLPSFHIGVKQSQRKRNKKHQKYLSTYQNEQQQTIPKPNRYWDRSWTRSLTKCYSRNRITMKAWQRKWARRKQLNNWVGSDRARVHEDHPRNQTLR